MTHEALLTLLRSQRAALEAKGVTALYMFGSQARGEADPDSDVDLFLEYTGPFSILSLAGVKTHLEAHLSLPVDVTTRKGLHPRIRPAAEAEAVQIF